MMLYVYAVLIGLVITVLIFIKTRGKKWLAIVPIVVAVVAAFAINHIPSRAPAETASSDPVLRSATPASKVDAEKISTKKPVKAENEKAVVYTMASAIQNGSTLEGSTFERGEDSLWRVRIPARIKTLENGGKAQYQARSMRLAANAKDIFREDGVYDLILVGDEKGQGSGVIGTASVKIVDGMRSVKLAFDCESNREYFGTLVFTFAAK